MNKDTREKLALLSQKSAPKEDISAKELRETKEIKESAREVAEIVPVKEGKEAVEIVEGRVAEGIKEGKKRAPAGRGPVVKTADEIEAIRAKLLANLPSQEVMVKQIKRKLRVDEVVLTKQFKRLRKMGHKAAYQLNIVVAKLRKIHEYFSILANATFEIIKQLWLKIVHNV